MECSLVPARPTVADMLGAHILYFHARPHEREVILETGVVIGYQFRRKELFLKIQPDNPARLPKWISEFDFRAYVPKVEAPALAEAS